ncbi:MAG TPA: DNA double-strand break repair nuclease NurA [Acidimicrobiales bacterium]|nr:DNA double-strand break repair nuclease NurA [Acidimicrobiales bacterium]
MRFRVDPWDPAYGVANEALGLDATSAEVDPDVEIPAARWEAVAPRPASADSVASVLFVDGVRRVEARVWIDDGAGSAAPGICASYAAGAVRCDHAARLGPVLVERGLFTSFGAAEPVVTATGDFPVRLAASDSPEGLALALQERMGHAELRAAESACEEGAADLVVVDGPLRGRQHLANAVGYVKTHHVAYLPPELHAIVGGLAPGQRSPLFVLGGGFSRLSWYLRLPGPAGVPWAGVVRCECTADLPVAAASRLADQVVAVLPRFASEPHKEPRAPQNLYPVAGLERELRRRMGDPHLLYRALRRSAARAGA